MIECVAIIIVLTWIISHLILLGLGIKKAASRVYAEKEPVISILIALRNEESHIPALCESLKGLSYPTAKVEILFGDDASTDRSLELLKEHKPTNATIYSFTEKETGLFGKKKVLARLSQKAVGEYLVFTDADMTFQEDWIQGLLQESSEPNELVVGLTKVSGSGWLARMQNIDWLFNEQIVSTLAKMGVYLTAWGNNLLISKEVYDAIGGHDDMEDTLVEDVGLLKKLVSHGGRLKVSQNESAVGTTQAVPGFWELLQQRKRWMKEIRYALLWAIPAVFLKILFGPAIVCLVVLNLWWLAILLPILMIRYLILRALPKPARPRVSVADLLLFEVYDFAFYLFTFAFYFLPVRITWKGRKY